MTAFFLRYYRNSYALVPSLSEGRLMSVDFEKQMKHKPRRWPRAKAPIVKVGVMTLVVTLQIQQEPMVYNLLCSTYRHSLLFL